MEIKEEFERKIYFILKRLKQETLTSFGNEIVYYKLQKFGKAEGIVLPTKEDQAKIIFDLNSSGVINIGHNTSGESLQRFNAKMVKKGVPPLDYTAYLPSSETLAFTINQTKLENWLAGYEIKFGNKIGTKKCNHAYIAWNKETMDSPWLSCNCGNLSLNRKSGQIVFIEKSFNVKPNSQTYILLNLLLSDCGKVFSYNEISKAMGKKVEMKQRDISFIIRNLRNSLKVKSGSKNDFIEALNGYRIRC